MELRPVRASGSPWMRPADRAVDRADSDGRIRRTTRDWLVDGLAWLVAAGWAALMTGLVVAGDYRVPEAVSVADITAGWLAAMAVWLRRRWPVRLAIGLLVTGFFSMAAGLAALIALFTVAAYRRPAVALSLGAGYAATGLVYFAYAPSQLQPGNSYWANVLWAAVVTGLVVGWGMFARARHLLVLSLRDRALRAEAEQQLRAEQARHMERERIAREMHDLLAHRISLVSMHAGALEYRPDADPTEVARAAGVIRESAHQALQDLREVLGVLRLAPGDDVRPQPGLADLPALIEESRQAGVRVALIDRVVDPRAVPAAIGRTAYRIVQEGLTNARKHAAGATVTAAVAGAAGEGLTVTVTNPPPVGGGPEDIPGTGTGLVGLAERVELAGGRLTHGPGDDGGFGLTAWLPWPA